MQRSRRQPSWLPSRTSLRRLGSCVAVKNSKHPWPHRPTRRSSTRTARSSIEWPMSSTTGPIRSTLCSTRSDRRSPLFSPSRSSCAPRAGCLRGPRWRGSPRHGRRSKWNRNVAADPTSECPRPHSHATPRQFLASSGESPHEAHLVRSAIPSRHAQGAIYLEFIRTFASFRGEPTGRPFTHEDVEVS